MNPNVRGAHWKGIFQVQFEQSKEDCAKRLPVRPAMLPARKGLIWCFLIALWLAVSLATVLAAGKRLPGPAALSAGRAAASASAPQRHPVPQPETCARSTADAPSWKALSVEFKCLSAQSFSESSHVQSNSKRNRDDKEP